MLYGGQIHIGIGMELLCAWAALMVTSQQGRLKQTNKQTLCLVCSTPLPPLPTESKHLVASSSETPSNRSSASSSSAYGHLLIGAEEQGTDDEDIYSKPMVTTLFLVPWSKILLLVGWYSI